ncbi:arca-like protein [Colletotrichum kahawae]|uniref:Arca-like protein n=1 Tax=Colletotrichum kahawae TaxID=34407 RepID=A0AAD9Y9F6_COLKA|nr:arca-like protein [Colletotrichum kahawae]
MPNAILSFGGLEFRKAGQTAFETTRSGSAIGATYRMHSRHPYRPPPRRTRASDDGVGETFHSEFDGGILLLTSPSPAYRVSSSRNNSSVRATDPAHPTGDAKRYEALRKMQRCAERHEKCDDQQPRCSRCEKRGVECVRPQRRPSFRQGSTANYDGAFSREQRWVNSKPKAFRFDSRNNKTGGGPQAQDTNNESPISNTASLPDRIAVNTALHEAVRNLSETPEVLSHERRLDDVQSQRLPTPTKRRRTETVPHDGGQFLPASPSGSDTSGASPWSTTALPSGRVRLNEEPHVPSPHATGPSVTIDQFSPSADSFHQPSEHDPVGSLHTHRPPSDGIQEACLLRYFTEELSQWFDLCDEERHFQLIVTRRARACQPLRDAVLAVAARHLCRHPRFRTEPGGVIVYQNQLLPDLTPQSAIEYMLRCIPALHEVSRTQDEEYRENLAAAALILRQFEEMDPEEAQSATSSDFGNGIGNVNFLDITKAILRAAPSRWSGLLSAVYWVAVRQEIYFALTLERSPQISAQPPDLDRDTCFANKLIWFMSEVAKWKMGERSGAEWERLRSEEEVLLVEAARHFIPIVQRSADRSRGEIFPLVWYGSDIEVTALQHFILARMILVAEDPNLHGQVSNRRAQRDAEHQVRAMILELCGLALHHLRAPPNLTTAGMGIMLYGDYFNDPWERTALLGVLEEWRNQHAWPVRKGYQALGISNEC